MIIKDSIYRNCMLCGKKELVTGPVYGCDYCKKVLHLHQNEEVPLLVTLFNHSGDHHAHEFCSWECVLRFLQTASADYFIALPELDCENPADTASLDNFLKAARDVFEGRYD